ncbi:hypothetical protein [Mucilaginibacter flavus]|uniref:hypothetical protein n=1 Tax=Mucilaginibacter flavus TaxID=931504 RepID=UPI0025B43D3B|nr:hypothetical protein [Mucilaginibacter flavus]MDN3582090.1 hypothetical protein [Mucilaginibacter flavus]
MKGTAAITLTYHEMRKLLIALFIFQCSLALGQSVQKDEFDAGPYDLVYFGPTVQTIVVDPQLNSALAPLPFDRFFYLRVYVKASEPPLLGAGFFDDDNILVKLYAQKIPTPNTSPDYKAGYTLYQITVTPLDPKREYDFFTFTAIGSDEITKVVDALNTLRSDMANGDPDTKAKLPNYYSKMLALNAARIAGDPYSLNADAVRIYYEEKVKPLLDGVSDAGQINQIMVNVLQKDIYVNARLKKKSERKSNPPSMKDDTVASTKYPLFLASHEYFNSGFKQFSADARASSVITVDAGYVGYGLQNNFVGSTTYIGLDFYLRPFDPNIPFRFVRHYNGLSILDRTSLTLGITLNSVAKTNYRADLFGTKNNLMGGIGFRLNNLFKVNAGGLVYYKLDPNFLTGQKHLAVTPYVGMSVDIRLGTIFSSFAKLFSL